MPYKLQTLQELIENFEKDLAAEVSKFRTVMINCRFRYKKPIPEQTAMRLMPSLALFCMRQNR